MKRCDKIQKLCVITYILINILLFTIVLKYYWNLDVMNIVFIVGVIHTLAFNRAQRDFVMMTDSDASNDSEDNE